MRTVFTDLHQSTRREKNLGLTQMRFLKKMRFMPLLQISDACSFSLYIKNSFCLILLFFLCYSLKSAQFVCWNTRRIKGQRENEQNQDQLLLLTGCFARKVFGQEDRKRNSSEVESKWTVRKWCWDRGHAKHDELWIPYLVWVMLVLPGLSRLSWDSKTIWRMQKSCACMDTQHDADEILWGL